MGKAIVHYPDDWSLGEALEFVDSVVGQGRISDTSKGPQYCFATRFSVGTMVYAGMSRKGTDVFRVVDNTQAGEEEE